MTVSGEGNWFILIILQFDVVQFSIGNILHINPFHFEVPSPLSLLAPPDAGPGLEVHEADHLCHATEVFAPHDTEQEVDWTLTSLFSVSMVQLPVSLVIAGPQPVLDAGYHVLHPRALDDEVLGAVHGFIRYVMGIEVHCTDSWFTSDTFYSIVTW